jgi:hypothetical protein
MGRTIMVINYVQGRLQSVSQCHACALVAAGLSLARVSLQRVAHQVLYI